MKADGRCFFLPFVILCFLRTCFAGWRCGRRKGDTPDLVITKKKKEENKNMIREKLADIIKRMIYMCSGAIIAYLLLVNLLSTCVYGANTNGNAHVFYLRDYPIIHIVSIAAVLGVIYWLKNKAV